MKSEIMASEENIQIVSQYWISLLCTKDIDDIVAQSSQSDTSGFTLYLLGVGHRTFVHAAPDVTLCVCSHRSEDHHQ